MRKYLATVGFRVHNVLLSLRFGFINAIENSIMLCCVTKETHRTNESLNVADNRTTTTGERSRRRSFHILINKGTIVSLIMKSFHNLVTPFFRSGRQLRA